MPILKIAGFAFRRFAAAFLVVGAVFAVAGCDDVGLGCA